MEKPPVAEKPIKIILSRKGMDSGEKTGGLASPVLEDGTLLSLPILENDKVKDADKEKHVGTTYSQIEYKGIPYSRIIRDLSTSKSKVWEQEPCHVDPDLEYRYVESVVKKDDWKAAFGQHGSSQRHLQNQSVGVGDIFLFYGWFRPVKCVNGRYKYIDDNGRVASNGKHIIWGYMQVGAVIPKDKISENFKYHPHSRDYFMKDSNNAIYLPMKDHLSFCPAKKSYGLFKYDLDGSNINFARKHTLDLTMVGGDNTGCKRSYWDLEGLRKKIEITYHKNGLGFQDNQKYFQSNCRGQEFVINPPVVPGSGSALDEWLMKILAYAPDIE